MKLTLLVPLFLAIGITTAYQFNARDLDSFDNEYDLMSRQEHLSARAALLEDYLDNLDSLKRRDMERMERRACKERDRIFGIDLGLTACPGPVKPTPQRPGNGGVGVRP